MGLKQIWSDIIPSIAKQAQERPSHHWEQGYEIMEHITGRDHHDDCPALTCREWGMVLEALALVLSNKTLSPSPTHD